MFQIIEFVKFRERLKNSFQYAAAKTERMLLDLTMETIRLGHHTPQPVKKYIKRLYMNWKKTHNICPPAK